MKLFLSLSGAFFSSVLLLAPLLAQTVGSSSTSSQASDPGVRVGSVNAGQPISALTPSQLEYFNDGFARFNEVDQVANGLGPTYNATSCGSCHAQPTTGGTSPREDQYPNIGPNPQIAAANASGATNKLPSFITADGPVREARFPFALSSNATTSRTADGGVHALFTITGRSMRPAVLSVSRISRKWQS